MRLRHPFRRREATITSHAAILPAFGDRTWTTLASRTWCLITSSTLALHSSITKIWYLYCIQRHVGELASKDSHHPPRSACMYGPRPPLHLTHSSAQTCSLNGDTRRTATSRTFPQHQGRTIRPAERRPGQFPNSGTWAARIGRTQPQTWSDTSHSPQIDSPRTSGSSTADK